MKNTHLHMIHSLFRCLHTGLASQRLDPIKPKSGAWVLLRTGHFQMAIMKNVFHKVRKPRRRLERMFLRLKTYTEVYTNDFMCVFSTISDLPCKIEE